MRATLLWAAALLLASCGQRHTLTERHARATAEALIAARGPQLHDFHHMDWKSFVQVSPTEAVGTAVMVYRFQDGHGAAGEDQVPGRFVFHRTPGHDWVLDMIDFPNPHNLYHSVSEHAFAKVTSAAVPTGGLEQGAARELADRERKERPDGGTGDAQASDEDSAGAGGDTAGHGGSDAP